MKYYDFKALIPRKSAISMERNLVHVAGMTLQEALSCNVDEATEWINAGAEVLQPIGMLKTM